MMTSVTNDLISVEHSFDEQQLHVNNQQNDQLIVDQSNPERVVRTIKYAKKGPMNPTPLEYSCWSRHRTATAVGAAILYTLVTITIGALTVYFTAPEVKIPTCQLKFKSTPSNPIEYNYGPRSVAVGYFNNDIWLDMVVANHLANQIVIYLTDNSANFTTPRNYSTGTGSNPYMVVVGDLNNDHQLDIAVANFDSNSIGVFIGQEDGSVTSAIVTSTGSSRPYWIHLAQLNNDTHLDVVTANYGTQSISVLYGYGNGSFSDPIMYSTGYDSFPYSVIAGDFNNDTLLDLAVANYGTSNVGIFLAYDNGTFADQKIFSTGIRSHPYSLTVGYFNDDHLLDIAIANYGTNDVSILFGSGNGTFGNQINHSLGGASPYSINVGDFNRDNRPDLVVSNKGNNNIAVLLGYGNSTFSEPKMYSTGSKSSISVVIGDFNNDNRLDIVVVNNDTYSIGILLGVDEGYPYQTMYSTDSMPQFVAVDDFNNDNKLDIVVANSNSYNISMLLGYGNGSFADQMTYSTDYHPQSVAVGDFNNDSHLDLVIANQDDQFTNVLLGYGNGSFANRTKTFTQSYSMSVSVGDVNNDNRLDIIGGQYSGKDIYLLLGCGNGSFASPVMYAAGNNVYSTATGDFNNDTLLDVVVANWGDSNVSVLLGYGDGSFARQKTFATGTWPYSVAVGDFNNDTQLDLVVANKWGRSVSVLLGYGNGSFANQIPYSTGSSPVFVAVGDFNNDTVLDIVVANSGDHNVSVFHGYGNGSFTNQKTYATGNSPYSVAVGDFNNDSRLDMVVANNNDSSVSVLLHYNSGALGNETTFASGNGSRLQYVVVSDIDRDNRLDLIVANYGTNNIGVLFGHGNGTFESQKTFTTGSNSHPYSIAIGNFNKDDDLDIIVANYGTHNVYMFLGDGKGAFVLQSSTEMSLNFTPCAIATGDLNNDGQSEIVAAYYDSDNVDVFIAYDSGALRDQKTYSTGDEPLSVAVGDFNNDSQLDIVATSFSSWPYHRSVEVFLGYGNGSFANPETYASGGSDSLAVSDFNNDNELDIVVADHDHDNIGILLGYGNGSFAPPETFSVGRGPSSLSVGDFNNDNQLDIVVVNNYYGHGSVLLGYGNGSFAEYITFATSDFPTSVAVGDFNDDHRMDIVIGDSNDIIDVHLGYGNGSFAHQKTYPVVNGATSVVVGDLNNDTRLDIVTGGSDVNIFLGDGHGSFTEQVPHSILNEIEIIALVDFNNDHRLDIVFFVNSADSSCVGILLGDGAGSFGTETTYITGYASTSAAVGDFNNDNRLDIVVSNRENNNIGVLIGYVNLMIARPITLMTGTNSRPRSFVINDFNNDNQMDIAVANSASHCIGIFLGYNNYSFTNQTTYDTGFASSPRSIAVGDFNKDNYLDIVVANYGNDSIGVFLGDGNGSFSNQKTFTTGPYSQPYSVAVDDFNNDTFPDIIVANYATNEVRVFVGDGNGAFADIIVISTGYGSHPFFVVTGDFNNDKKVDFAVANEGSDSLKIFLQTC